MDVLNDYGSSSSSEDEHEEAHEPTKDYPSETLSKQHDDNSKISPSRSTSSKLLETGTVMKNESDNNKDNTNRNISEKATKGRGVDSLALRKKIASLQGIIPAHIFDQLNKAQLGDDDEEEDDDGDPSTTAAATSSTNKTTAPASQDPGVSKLLQALHNKEAKKDFSSRNHKNTAGSLKEQQQQNQPVSTSMGAAFLSTSTTTTTISKTGDDVVRNIHGEAQLPDYKGGEDDDEHDVNESSNNGDGDHKNENKNAPTEKRLLFTKLAVAPRVQVAPLSEVNKSDDSREDQQFLSTKSADTENALPVEERPRQSKRIRKEMERLLRHGQIDDAIKGGGSDQQNNMNSNTGMIHLEQASPNDFVPQQPEVDQVPAHGVRNVPTQMYDPSAGGTVTGVRGRGKNQISHLLGQAANLELARARGMTNQGGSSGAGSVHRMNAKRKYGW